MEGLASRYATTRAQPHAEGLRALQLGVVALGVSMLAALVVACFPGPLTLIVLAPAMVVAGAFLFRLRAHLKPIAEIATMLEAGSGGAGAKAEPGRAIDDPLRLRANVEAIIARLEKRTRQRRRHSLTGLMLQNEFLALANDDIEGKPRTVLLGLVRLANYDAIAAFDPDGAEHVLSKFARRLAQALDPSRVLAHIDRDCFAIWFRGVAPHVEASAELQALSYVLSQEVEAGALTITPDVQIGSAQYPVDSGDAANLLSRAFVSLARPQRTSTGELEFFALSSLEQTKRRFMLEQKLRKAVEQQQLEIYYQPIIDTAKGAVTGAEALLRWRHPALGPIAPTEFVPILEETGLIEDIGLWSLNAACKQLRLWRDAGLDLKLAINVSARQLREPLLGKIIARTLMAHNLVPTDLDLELTETTAMRDTAGTKVLFEQLRALGFGLSIDDFGSGYSSLGYLKNLPFTKLKIDREFVAHVDTRPGSQAICKALIELTRGLGIGILAEGVERREEVETLKRLGCQAFQGFYFAKPMPAAALHAAIAAQDWSALIGSPVHRQQQELRRRIT